jgi:uncharacterized protein (TIGR03437 family)
MTKTRSFLARTHNVQLSLFMAARIVACLGLLFLISAGANAQTLRFTKLAPSDDQPSPRFDAPITYDPTSQQIYLFGGQADSPQNDLWAYSVPDSKWTAVQASGSLPPGRFGHTLVFDPIRRRLLTFGGQNGASFFNDTWAFDLQLQQWQLIDNGSVPAKRYGHSAIYDPVRDRMIVSHGFTDAGRFDDTWAFDLSRNAWADISPPSNRPLRRCLHHAVYDPVRDQMLLYAGCSSGFGPCPQDDLWSFDLRTNLWTQINSPTKPPARERYGVAYDLSRSRMVVFGGDGASGLLNDTWEYDPAVQNWTLATIDGDPPAPRNRHETTYAPDLKAIFFFGGNTAGGSTNELWMLAPTQAPTPVPANPALPSFSAQGVVNAFSSIAGAFAPGEIVSIFGAGLGSSAGIATSFDPQTGKLPVQAGGTSVTWNGIAAPLFFVRSDQLNVQIPYELADSNAASVVVNYQGLSSAAVPIPLGKTHPGLVPYVINQDFSLNSADHPAADGSIIVLFATGAGVTIPPSSTGAYPVNGYPAPAAPVALQVDGILADILFQGQAPGTAGVLQVNARLPAGLRAATPLPVTLTIGDNRSQAGISLWVQ